MAGLGLGLAMGLVITWNLDRDPGGGRAVLGFDVLPANIYQFDGLPYEIDPQQLLLIAVIAMVLLDRRHAASRPGRASRLDPAEALRYE